MLPLISVTLLCFIFIHMLSHTFSNTILPFLCVTPIQLAIDCLNTCQYHLILTDGAWPGRPTRWFVESHEYGKRPHCNKWLGDLSTKMSQQETRQSPNGNNGEKGCLFEEIRLHGGVRKVQNIWHLFTNPLWGEASSHWWVSIQKIWFFIVSMKKLLNKQFRWQ